jgi:hypothetical protein
MKNYRIKKEYRIKEYGMYFITYTPQKKILFWWRNVFHFNPGFDTLEQAREALCKHLRKPVVEYCKHLRKPVVEYIDFDCERDCK